MAAGHAIVGGVLSLVITTSSWDVGQAPLLSVQRNVLGPTAKPLTEVVGELAFANVPDPPMTDHVPLPLADVLAAKLVEVPQIAWSGPALATVFVCTATEVLTQPVVLQVPSARTK